MANRSRSSRSTSAAGSTAPRTRDGSRPGVDLYRIIPSAIGDVGVVRFREGGLLRRILLPRRGVSLREAIAEVFPGAEADDGGDGDLLCDRLRDLLAGKPVEFSLAGLDLTGVGGFARRVLTLDHAIPRGRVMTYAGMAVRLGVPGGARAVGNVMARNPVPLVVPCHRVVGSDRGLRGFGGGLAMKRTLLEMEGVAFDRRGRVLSEYLLEG
ncbi:MAG: methylated-DNA--[protein]-cysteine S-methyltransferase [Syntrophales bacterium]